MKASPDGSRVSWLMGYLEQIGPGIAGGIRTRPAASGHNSKRQRLRAPRLRPGGERVVLREPHDYAVILLDEERIGRLDRGCKQRSIVLPDREE